MSEIEIGRLLRAGTTSCVVGCRVSQAKSPAFGGLVRIPLEETYAIYGLIYDIHIDDDGLVRQLVTAEGIDADVFLDNRTNRNIPVEISVLHVGYRQDARVVHLLPPRPPLSLDQIFICGPKEACAFTQSGRFGYLRHVLRSQDVPVCELIASHVQMLHKYHVAQGNTGWASSAVQELIVLLRDDYPTLMTVLSALSDVVEPSA